jgi:hypothetical protein
MFFFFSPGIGHRTVPFVFLEKKFKIVFSVLAKKKVDGNLQSIYLDQ